MGVNFSSFEIGRRALRASQLGLAVTGQNIANVNTPGYSRQTVQLSASAPSGANMRLTGTGVTIDGVRSFRERFVESRLQTETAISGRLTAQRDALAPVEAAFNESGSEGGISASLSGFFNSFGDLEANPTSVPVREVVIGKATTLATALQSMRARLDSIQHETDGALRGTVDEVNRLTEEVAGLNVAILAAENTGENAYELRDGRGERLRQLSELVGARSVENEDGTVLVTLGDGRALVIGDQTSSLTAVSGPPSGLATLTIDGQPAIISDGRTRGLLNAITETGKQILALDQLAESIATRVNTLHASGSDLDGTNGTPLFVAAGVPPITAANIDVSAAIKSNPRLVVAAALGQGSGDATVARDLSALLTDNTSTAGTRTGSFNSIFGSMVAEAGGAVRSADDALQSQQLILAQTTAQRDSFSGVSLDEEAINLLQYQRAYEAAARFLKISDEMTQTILALA